MKLRPIFTTGKVGFVLLNVLAAIFTAVLLVVLLYGALYVYTDHGVEVEVPYVRGMLVEDAESMANSVGLELFVVDSIFDDSKPHGIILEQTPPPNSHAKRHRYLYVTMTAKCKRKVPVPDVRGYSLRQARVMLEAMKLNVINVVYEPYEHRDLVMDITYNNAPVKKEEYLYEGSGVTLVVGSGNTGGTHAVVVPDLKGMTYEEAKQKLEECELVLGTYQCDEEFTEENFGKFVVYTQSPLKGSDALDGDEVAIMLTRNLQQKLQQTASSSVPLTSGAGYGGNRSYGGGHGGDSVKVEVQLIEALEICEKDTFDDENF